MLKELFDKEVVAGRAKPGFLYPLFDLPVYPENF
jgi:hypothetical protein